MRIESNLPVGIGTVVRVGPGPTQPAPEELPQSTEREEPNPVPMPDTPVTGDPMARTLAPLPLYGAKDTAASPDSTETDPRFAAVNDALRSGDAQEAVSAAKDLLAALQKAKPPQPRLLNQARMALAAAALLAGDLDTAQKALLTVNVKALKDGESDQFNELRDLVKEARQEAYSEAFQTDGKAAAAHAAKLLELLQKTDSGNTAEISEARLKNAHALLTGDNYRDAEKALQGIGEKSLSDDQKEYLSVLRDGIQAQRIDALSKAYDYDMKRKNFKDAATNATVIVNNLAKYFPDSKDHLVVARLQQATAQIMKGDMEDARKSLARIDRDHLKQMDESVGKRFKTLSGAVYQHFENVKKEQALKAEAAIIEGELKTIEGLTSSGKQADAVKAIPLAEKLLAKMKEKYPDNEAAVAGARLTLANAKMAAGDMAGAKADLQDIANTAKEQATKDRVQLMQAQVALKEKETNKAVQMLRTLSTSAATPELRKAAKGVIIELEISQLKNIESKLKFEQKRLDDIKDDKTPQSKLAFLNPITSLEQIGGHYDRMHDEHMTNMNWLLNAKGGAALAAIVMRQNGLTLSELQSMTPAQIAKLPRVGEQTAGMIGYAINIGDAKQIGRGDFQGKFSWDTGQWYVDPSYLDHTYERSAKWMGEKLRELRSHDEDLKESDKWYHRAAGYTSGAILDAVSAANNFVKDSIKNASEFYNDPARKDTWYAKLGRAGTFGADMLTMPFTAPATVADYKATDAERSQAMLGTVLMLGGVRLAKNLGPALKSFAAPVAPVASRIAASRAAQWVANSEFGQLVGSAAQKIGSKAAQADAWVQSRGISKGIDKLTDTLGKINRFGRPAVPTTGRSMETALDDLVGDKTAAELQAGITPQQIKSMERELIADQYSKLVRAKKNELALKGQNLSDKEVRAILQKEHPGDKLRETLLRSMRSEFTEADIRRMVLGSRIYKASYHGEIAPKPASISQAKYEEQLALSKGRKLSDEANYWESPNGKAQIMEDGHWHHRVSKVNGEIGLDAGIVRSGEGIRRFYFNIKPDKAAEFADHLTARLNEANVKWQYKMPKELKSFDRPDSGVLYVSKADYQTVKKIVMEYAEKNPAAFAEGIPSFTKQLHRGIGAAEEPIQIGLPKTVDRHSFGSSRSDIMAEAILSAPPGATRKEIMALVRERMKTYGLDVDRPWLSRASNKDDL